MGSLSKLLDELTGLLERLSEEAERGTPIIVEGPSDVEALRTLGIHGTFVAVKACRKPLVDVVHDIPVSAGGEVILLMDFDRAGREQARKLAEELTGFGFKVNLSYWHYLMALVGSFAKDIEGLPSLVETLMRKVGPRLK